MSGHAANVPGGAKGLGVLGAIILVFSIVYQGAGWTFLNTPEKGGVQNLIGTYYKVTKVTDGDTLHIEKDGEDTVVRLIGINTPETVDPRRPVECFGKEATNKMKSLVNGENVRLEYDDSQSLYDSYDRLLAYVYLEDGQMLNRKMIADGYAYEYTYMTPYKYQQEFRELQNLARTSERGLWAPESCNGQK